MQAMRTKTIGCFAVLLCVALSTGLPPCWGQTEAGTAAGVTGVTEIARAGSVLWEPLVAGTPVYRSDRIRTGNDGTVKIIFSDDSVVELAPDGEFSIDVQLMMEPDAKRFRSRLRLAAGKLRAVASKRYDSPSGRYEVETPTAVVAAHGSEFIVSYRVTEGDTDVISVNREVVVQGKAALNSPAVKVGPQEITRIAKGASPTTPRAVDESTIGLYRQGLEVVGTGQLEGLVAGHNALSGLLLRNEDRPEMVEGRGAAATAEIPSFLEPPVASETLADRLSPDLRANTQPILEFRAAKPGQRPSGGVHVGF